MAVGEASLNSYVKRAVMGVLRVSGVHRRSESLRGLRLSDEAGVKNRSPTTGTTRWMRYSPLSTVMSLWRECVCSQQSNRYLHCIQWPRHRCWAWLSRMTLPDAHYFSSPNASGLVTQRGVSLVKLSTTIATKEKSTHYTNTLAVRRLYTMMTAWTPLRTLIAANSEGKGPWRR